jgi:beta-1,4-N-acetylglucosaminyltransferase
MKVLVVLGDGGHTADTLKLVELLGPKYEYSYLMSDGDQISEGKIKFAGPVYRAPVPHGKVQSLLASLRPLFLCTIREFVILLKVRPRVILNGAAGIGVPISILGRLLGVKVIYLENASRVYSLSLSGRILYHVAHLFFVQWESLKEKYPKVIYAGRLI